MQNIERMLVDSTVQITKKERLTLSRELERMNRVLGGIANLNKLPSAIFLVDIGHEHLALQESDRLGIRTFGMVDTNCDPNLVDFAIPSNDDASRSIALITAYLVEAIKEGLADRTTKED